MMDVYDSCCFCIPLRRGCFIIAYLQLLGGLRGTVFALLTIAAADLWSHPATADDMSYFVIAANFLLLLIVILSVCFSIVLIVGLYKNDPKLLRAYIIYNVVFLIIYLIMFVVIYVKVKSERSPAGVIAVILNIAVSGYFLLVIKSYHIKLVKEQEEEQSNTEHTQI